MSPQSRLERYEQRTEWPLAGVAILFLALYSVRGSRPHPTVRAGDRCVRVLAALYCASSSTTSSGCISPDRAAGGSSGTCPSWPIIVLPFLRPLRLLSLAVVINMLQRAIGDTIRGG